MSDEITVERQVEALLAIVDALDPWTAKFVRSLADWIKHGRRLTARQREVLGKKFGQYRPQRPEPDRPTAAIQPPAPALPFPQPPGMIVEPIRGKPGYLSVTVMGPSPSPEVSQAIAMAMAERATLKGPLH